MTSGMSGTFLRNPWVLRFLSLAFVLSLWQYVGGRMNPIFLSTPLAIFEAAVKVIASGELPWALLVSLGVVFSGFALAIVVGVPLGLLMGRSRIAEYLLDPYVNALYVVPRIALIPLIIIWLGLGIPAQIAVVFGTSGVSLLISPPAGGESGSANLMVTARPVGGGGNDVGG